MVSLAILGPEKSQVEVSADREPIQAKRGIIGIFTGRSHGRLSDLWCIYTVIYIIMIILVGGLEHFLFSIIYGIILPIDLNIF